MAAVKEFREFFLRHSFQNTGSKADQELGFPYQYLINGVEVYNRFLNGDYPNRAVFEKLFESITFKLNPEDTANVNYQGLVKAATDGDSSNQVETFGDGMSRAVLPYQIHSTEADNTGHNVTVTVTPYLKSLTGGRTRKAYKISADYTPTAGKIRVLTSQPSPVLSTILNSGGPGIEYTKTYNLPANTLASNGDYLEIEGRFSQVANISGGNNLCVLGLTLGTTIGLYTGNCPGALSDAVIRSKVTRISSTVISVETIIYSGSLFSSAISVYRQAKTYNTFDSTVNWSINMNISMTGGGTMSASNITTENFLVKLNQA